MNQTKALIKNLPDGSYELFCPVCGEKYVPKLPIPLDMFTDLMVSFGQRHNHRTKDAQ